MYQVLYRKYRPKTFEDVVGQEHVTTTLKNEIKLNRINHAYLFTGSRGTGKTTCAKILAKAVNCLSPLDSNPCNECENCLGIESGEIMDVVEMDAASNRKIDNIRDIIDEVAFTPAKAKYRVYIIDEVHMLTTEAFNALLKTLEEPPEHVIFILATTEVHKLPSTIASRCQRFDFHRISPSDIASRIKNISEKENVKITDEAAMLISVIADGALRDAISLLDRCIGICDDISIEVVRTAAGLASKNHLFELCNTMINKNPEKALSIIESLYMDSKDMARLCDELISHFRILMLIKTVRNAREMIALSDKEFEAATAQADYLTLADIVYYMDVLQRSFERMGKGVADRIELETAVVKLTSAELDFSNEALLSRLSSLEKQLNLLKAEGVTVRYEKKTEDKKDEAVKKESEKTEEKETESNDESDTETEEKIEEKTEDIKEEKTENLSADDIADKADEDKKISEEKHISADEKSEKTQEEKPVGANKSKPDLDEIYKNAKPFLKWPEVVENIRLHSESIANAFVNCNAYESGDYLLIDSDQKLPFQLLTQSSQRQNVRKAISEITGRTYKLGPYKREKQEEKKKDEVFESFIAQLKESGISVSEE